MGERLEGLNSKFENFSSKREMMATDPNQNQASSMDIDSSPTTIDSVKKYVLLDSL